MNPGRPPDTEAAAALRKRGLELFLSSERGHRLSLRAIAKELGVHLKTVQNWRDKDGWNTEARRALAAAGGPLDAEDPEIGLREFMAHQLRGHVKRLNRLIKDPATRSDVMLRALSTFTDIYKKLGGRLADAPPDKPEAPAFPAFQDDLAAPE